MLQFVGLQRVGHNLATEQQVTYAVTELGPEPWPPNC